MLQCFRNLIFIKPMLWLSGVSSMRMVRTLMCAKVRWLWANIWQKLWLLLLLRDQFGSLSTRSVWLLEFALKWIVVTYVFVFKLFVIISSSLELLVICLSVRICLISHYVPGVYWVNKACSKLVISDKFGDISWNFGQGIFVKCQLHNIDICTTHFLRLFRSTQLI